MENPSKLVALLESDYEIAVKLNNQDIRSTLMAGMNWPTDYWVSCALKWLEQGANIDSEIHRRLEHISKAKQYSQSNRHKALKIAKRWERNASV